MLLKLLLICAVLGTGFSEKVRYDNFALYKVHPQNEADIKFLKALEEKHKDLDFWKTVSQVGDYASVVAPPELRRKFEHSLRKRSIQTDLMLDNLQEAFDAQSYSRRKRDVDGPYWTNYQSMETIYEWFHHLAATYPNIVTIVTLGSTFEGRNITGVRISRGSSNRHFVLEGGQIGADWLSPTVITYIVNQLVLGEDPEAKAASEEFVWHIFPVVNPDGHQYSLDAVRLWTKNRRPTSNWHRGVDLSKNWNSQWGVINANFDLASNNYPGLGPFSEVETRLLSEYILSLHSNLVGFISFRSFGQRLLIPFAHSAAPMYNYNETLTIGRRAIGSLSVKYGTQYLVGTSSQVYDRTTGTSADWVKYRINPPISLTMHLRDLGVWGYTLPVNQVLPSCEETHDFLMGLLREAKYLGVL